MSEGNDQNGNGKNGGHESDHKIYRPLLPIGTEVYDEDFTNQDSGAQAFELRSPTRVQLHGIDYHRQGVRCVVLDDRMHGHDLQFEVSQIIFVENKKIPRKINAQTGEEVIDENDDDDHDKPEPPIATQPTLGDLDDIAPKETSKPGEYFKKGL